MRAQRLARGYGEVTWICAGCRSTLARRAFRTTALSRENQPSSTSKELDSFFDKTLDPGRSRPRESPSRKPFQHRADHSGALSGARAAFSELVGENPIIEPAAFDGPAAQTPSPTLTRTPILPDGPARTRFAPSPTGYLHIGGLRTALFSYLLAKRTGGQFILRIEDTDQKRLVPDAEAKLLEDLRWAGITWDEGPDASGPHGPYKQSLRNDIYQKHARELLESSQAYRCFCTPQTAGEAKAAYVTSGCYQNCSSLPAEQSQDKAANTTSRFTIRLRQPHDAHKRKYPDLIYGNIQRLKRSPSAPLSASEDDSAIDAADTILVKSDGTPTYHFANVVDDHLMGITHVIRGSEWAASTPLHYDIYSAFDWTPPKFAHVGLLVDQNKAKLSKRNSDLALDVASMRDRHGVLPAALTNFLALLGWSNPTKDDVMDLDELGKVFDLKFTRGNAMVRTEKLWFLQKAHVRNACSKGDVSHIRPLVGPILTEVQSKFPQAHMNRLLTSDPGGDDTLSKYIMCILSFDSANYKNAAQYVERNRYFFAFDPTQVPAEREYYDKNGTIKAQELHELVARIFHNGWTPRECTPIRDVSVSLPSAEQTVSRALTNETFNTAIDRWAASAPPEARDKINLVLQPDADRSSKEQGLRQLLDLCRPNPAAQLKGPLMKYLREKLAYGLPGPHMSAVMAILGREECMRRLGIEERVGGEEVAEELESTA